MIPYLVAFLVSSGLFELGKTAEGMRRGRFASSLVYILAMLPLCIVAGARDLGIGTDTGGYGAFMYTQGLFADSFSSYLEALDGSYWDIAPLYALFSYIVIKLLGTQFAYFFAVEVAIVLPVFLVARRMCARHLGLPMLLYMLVLFIPSLNLMRQSVAMGLVLLAVIGIMECKKTRAVIFLILGVLTHTSAVVGVAFCLLWHVFFRQKNGGGWGYRAWAQPLMLLSVLVVLAAVLFFRQIAGFFADLEGVGRLFAYAAHSGSEYSTSSAFFVAFLTTGSLVMLKGINSQSRLNAVFFCWLISLCIPFYVLSGLDNTIARMMEYCALFATPLACLCFSKPGQDRIPIGLWIVAGSSAFRFFVCFAWQGFSAAIPYTSALLGIF
ncbi:EpsG family protein [Gordonibacter pamelaeae]|uniref:EpsG family protein n=1 Tax=Gordonibacter pamelaeae TaxID=471189 RepID=UPI002430281E|nr:EpsG family protein [Gordonibacter pamelaeae]